MMVEDAAIANYRRLKVSETQTDIGIEQTLESFEICCTWIPRVEVTTVLFVTVVLLSKS